jgi:hypothetical protein
MPVWFWLGSGAVTLVALVVSTAALVAVLRGVGREVTELFENEPLTLARPARTKVRPVVRV